MAKECTLYKYWEELPPGGLSMNRVVRITDRPDITSAVYRGHYVSNQTNKTSTSMVSRKSSINREYLFVYSFCFNLTCAHIGEKFYQAF